MWLKIYKWYIWLVNKKKINLLRRPNIKYYYLGNSSFEESVIEGVASESGIMSWLRSPELKQEKDITINIRYILKNNQKLKNSNHFYFGFFFSGLYELFNLPMPSVFQLACYDLLNNRWRIYGTKIAKNILMKIEKVMTIPWFFFNKFDI